MYTRGRALTNDYDDDNDDDDDDDDENEDDEGTRYSDRVTAASRIARPPASSNETTL